MKKILYLVILTVLLYKGLSADTISSCGVNLTTFGENYTLSASITDDSIDADCINVSANNITIDCGGLFIKSDDIFSAINSNRLYTTIKNCIINMTNTSAGIGVEYVGGSDDSAVYNTSFYNSYAHITVTGPVQRIQIENNTFDGSHTNNDGIRLSNAFNATILNNLFINNTNSVYVTGNKLNVSVRDNTFNHNRYGAYLSSTTLNTVDNNIFNNSYDAALYVVAANSNNFTNNNFTSNVMSILYAAAPTGNIFDDNYFYDNIGLTSGSATTTYENNIMEHNHDSYTYMNNTRQGSWGSLFEFQFLMRNMSRTTCSACAYTLSLNPPDEDLMNITPDHVINGNFTPNNVGIYNLRINVTDTDDNSELRDYLLFIDATSYTENYYFRGYDPENTPYKSVTSEDVGALTKTAPTSSEQRWCSAWVQFAFDELPTYIYNIKETLNYTIWYNNSAGAPTSGYQNRSIYGSNMDASSNARSGELINDTFGFNLDNIYTDYIGSWYTTNIKLLAISGTPYIFSNATDPSTVNITYLYSRYPKILSIDKDKTRLIYATMGSNGSTNADIKLEGEGDINVVFQMLSTGYDYDVLYDAVLCQSSADCTINSEVNGLINVTVNLASQHTITARAIIPESSPPSRAGSGPSWSDLPKDDYVNDTKLSIISDLSILDRLKDNTGIENGICEDGEIPFRDVDCALTMESTTCEGDRCIFKELWMFKALLIAIVCMVLFYKKDYDFFLVVILIFMYVNFISGASMDVVPLDPILPPTYTESAIESNVVLMIGSKIMPSNPIAGFFILLGVLYLIYNSLNKNARQRKW